eukprot:scaffold12308_cov71-Isochrysis_galbana.AAC.3
MQQRACQGGGQSAQQVKRVCGCGGGRSRGGNGGVCSFGWGGECGAIQDDRNRSNQDGHCKDHRQRFVQSWGW